jgi:hypothetical protein
MLNVNDELFGKSHLYYDRKGNPIGLMEWSILCNDDSYKIVKQEEIGPYLVSTVWIGLNMAIFGDVKLIFETMIFAKKDCDMEKDDPLTDYIYRYGSEDEALEGHTKAVEMVKAS